MEPTRQSLSVRCEIRCTTRRNVRQYSIKPDIWTKNFFGRLQGPVLTCAFWFCSCFCIFWRFSSELTVLSFCLKKRRSDVKFRSELVKKRRSDVKFRSKFLGSLWWLSNVGSRKRATARYSFGWRKRERVRRGSMFSPLRISHVAERSWWCLVVLMWYFAPKKKAE